MDTIEEKVLAVGEYVDRLVNIDPRARKETLELYQAARDKQGKPLCLLAAESLIKVIRPNRHDIVMFVTGFVSPTLLVGEQDGPVGSACLARALEEGFGVRPVVVTDEELLGEVRQTCRGAGFNVYDLERALTAGVKRGKSLAVIDFPKDKEQAKLRAKNLLDELHPAALIAIERPSMNEKGVYHGITGLDMTDITAKTDYLIEEANSKGILTIGIGDGGNELGCGLIEDAVKKYRPNNAKCGCSCGGTIASHISTKVLVFATISDWGAYGIEACLALLLKRPQVLHTDDTMIQTLREAVCAGSEDGHAGWVDAGSDGISWRVEVGVLRMLRTMVEEALVPRYDLKL